MGISGNLRAEYNPARIYNSISPNATHIPQFKVSDQELGKPEPPPAPIQSSVKTWLPIRETVALLFAFLFFQSVPLLTTLIHLILLFVWVYAALDKLPKYQKAKEKAEQEYQQALQLYQGLKEFYDIVVLPKWQNKTRPRTLAQKQQEWALQNLNIENVCRLKNWRIHSKQEIQETRDQGYIGTGEDAVVRAIKGTELQVCHQVQIRDGMAGIDYTADILCFNPATRKLCTVEIDGSQHWLKESQIEKDNERMRYLSILGVPTIRFVNKFAVNNTAICVQHVQQLLSKDN